MSCHCPTHGGCPCDDPYPMTIRQVWHRVSAFVTGATFFRFTLQNANMLSNPLIFAETVLSAEAAGQIANGGLDEDFDNPINMPATDSVQYAVNNGNSITGAFLRGSFWVKVSIP